MTKCKDKESLFSTGFGGVRSKVAKGSKYTMSCYNCAYFYQTGTDTQEVCQNNNVLPYDMVVTENNIYCGKWSPCNKPESVNSVRRLFKK